MNANIVRLGPTLTAAIPCYIGIEIQAVSFAMSPEWNACISEPNSLIQWMECHPATGTWSQSIVVLISAASVLLMWAIHKRESFSAEAPYRRAKQLAKDVLENIFIGGRNIVTVSVLVALPRGTMANPLNWDAFIRTYAESLRDALERIKAGLFMYDQYVRPDTASDFLELRHFETLKTITTVLAHDLEAQLSTVLENPTPENIQRVTDKLREQSTQIMRLTHRAVALTNEDRLALLGQGPVEDNIVEFQKRFQR